MRQELRFMIALVGTALCIQANIHYFSHLWIWHWSWPAPNSPFYVFTFLSRIGVPLIINLVYLKFSAQNLGLGFPRFSGIPKKTLAGIGLLAALLPGIIFLIRLDSSYVQYYSNLNPYHFLVFTMSTLPAWEFLHRGFLLFGLAAVFKKLKTPSGETIAIVIVCIFEVMFHFSKPPLEAFGMMLGSPILSLIALRTQSIWLPLLIHLYIEALFVFFVSG
jgi:membrane protease YdiL (CAAX protease family)